VVFFTGTVSKGSRVGRVIRREGWGVVLVPELLNKFSPSHFPLYFLDNGAFAYYQRGEEFKGELFLRALEAVEEAPVSPAFVVVPDRVAAGRESLEFSLGWFERLKREFPRFTYALVVQDGMEEGEVKEAVREFEVLFVGGSLEWKLKTGGRWVRLAHSLGKWCHVGRVGTESRLRWARWIGADSADSSLPLFSRQKLRNVVENLRVGFLF
jgi:hypothetical protein